MNKDGAFIGWGIDADQVKPLTQTTMIKGAKNAFTFLGGPDTPFPSPKPENEFVGLYNQVGLLRNEVSELRSALHFITEKLEKFERVEIEIRDITLKQAKREIKQFFSDHHGKYFDAADIQEALGINIDLAIKACEELKIEGAIK